MQQDTKILSVLEEFQTLSLEEASKVRLMNRVDRKYWFRFSELPELLQTIKDDYFIQTVEGKTWQTYNTQYYDTADNKMYTLHHNGKLNRYKIRRRDYMNTEDHFLEVKFKNNQGRTIKKRIETALPGENFNSEEGHFIDERSIFHNEDLYPALKNSFQRLTLISKKFNERCTLDVGLAFRSAGRDVILDDLVICELKSERGNGDSVLKRYLRDRRLKSSGFSKYCVGRALTDPTLKRNRFKKKIRELGKIIDRPELYYMEG